MNSAFVRSRTARRRVAGVLAALVLTVTGCAQADDARQLIVDAVPGNGGQDQDGGSKDRPNPTVTAEPELTKIDVSALADANQPGHYSFMTDNKRTCLFNDEEISCTGKAPADAPKISALVRPNAVKLTEDGNQYVMFEGMALDPGDVHAGEYFEHGGLRCTHVDAETFSCSMGDSGFTLSGPDGDMTFEGTFLDPSGNGSSFGSDDSESSGSSDSSGSSNSSGYVTSVSTGSGTVRASSPACDSRGILILESVVVQSGVDTEGAIADALATYPGSEFTTPGACPSLRAQLNGADIYAVYVDYGSDTSGLCSAAASTGGNARILSNRNEYVSPC